MKKILSLGFLSTVFILSACSGGSSGGGPGGDGTPTPTPTPTATPPAPGSIDTVVIGEPGLCSAGDVARVNFDAGGRARFSLINEDVDCTPAKDNRREEYTLMVYNTTASPVSFRLDSNINTDALPTLALSRRLSADDGKLLPPRYSGTPYSVGSNSMDEAASSIAERYEAQKKRRVYSRRLARAQFASAALAIGDEVEFRVRSSRDDPDEFTTTSAILRSQGDRINIFLDRDHPYAATDLACSAGPNPNDCLSFTALNAIRDIYEDNIYPLATTIVGSESDVDDDNRINVVITPVLNRNLIADAYTDSRSLLPFDPVSNIGSNESEVIFVHAPDSHGNYRKATEGSIHNITATDYLNKKLAAWIAFQFTKIISFNQHVLINGGAAEDDWIDDGMGAVIADLAGFNIWRPSVFQYLSQPQLDDLRKADDLDQEDFEGAEYLFMSYLLQSQMNGSVNDADSDGFDDDLQVFNRMVDSTLTGVANIQNAIEVDFDEDVETEFQSLFKDYAIAIATSGTNATSLQQNNDEVKYFFNLQGIPNGGATPVFGSDISNGAGSVRDGATGNDVGIDLNAYHSEEKVLIENGDEHVFAPGHGIFGYVDPFSVMYVRLSDLIQETQTISISGNTPQIEAFLLRRPNVTYPRAYKESIFGSIDQYAEDLGTAGPNPYWTNQGISKKIDLVSHAQNATTSGAAPDFVSILGYIDPPDSIRVCPRIVTDFLQSCPATTVPDTDKYTFTVPCIDGAGNELAAGACNTSRTLSFGGETQFADGFIQITVRRQFDNGSDDSTLLPFLALVSAKDVPYPYVPHPVRSGAAPDTRQQYRWITNNFRCGDADSTDDDELGAPCPANPLTVADEGIQIFKVEETDPQQYIEPNADLFASIAHDGDINGSGGNLSDECNFATDAFGANSLGYGVGGDYQVTSVEQSPSSLGSYSWAFQDFMTMNYQNFFPDALFARYVMRSASGYPSTDDETPYDPRSLASATLNCNSFTDPDEDEDEANDSPDDLLSMEELKRPSTVAEQILIEMSRGRNSAASVGGVGEEVTFPGAPTSTDLITVGDLDTQYLDFDNLAIDGDSRDTDTDCETVDFGNNMHGHTVRNNEGSILAGNYSALIPHIADNLRVPGRSDGQTIYNPPPAVANPDFGYTATIRLLPGRSYTLIVGGKNGTTGGYEIRMRKVSPDQIGIGSLIEPGKDKICTVDI